MEPKVRDLYKRFLLVGRDYPLGLGHVREKVKVAFFQNRDLTDTVAIKKAIKRGRWMVREMVGVIQLKKYRTLNSRYTPEDLREKLRDIENRRVLAEIEQQHEGEDVHPSLCHLPEKKRCLGRLTFKTVTFMVFISLEDVVGHSAGTTNCSMKHSVPCELPKPTTQVVVTPGSPAKQESTPIARAGLFNQRASSSPVYFVLYVSDSVTRQKWVLNKTSADHALLRKSIRRVGSGCKDPACCGHLQRIIKTSPSISTRRLWGSTTQYDQCSAFQTFVNDLVLAVLGPDTQCEAMQQTRHVLEEFLDIAHQRANAIDRVLLYENPATSPAAAPLEPCPAGQDCGDASDDSSECPICCGDLADDITLRLPCGHNYHAGCVRVWLNLQHTCPVCRLQLHEGVISY
ncbi:hypothetical protein JG687_00008169 [Phytophthora cactorum]|uniref:RING-type domain-containing protein n=2 Tax=Phytophthora cactorum TaxID=29920 RepID=A0A8T1UGA7_9STRA|nr:hypothetical protein JG687_00008169 [Phytophthora cactorum]